VDGTGIQHKLRILFCVCNATGIHIIDINFQIPEKNLIFLYTNRKLTSEKYFNKQLINS
jgi:hypothetical protein